MQDFVNKDHEVVMNWTDQENCGSYMLVLTESIHGQIFFVKRQSVKLTFMKLIMFLHREYMQHIF